MYDDDDEDFDDEEEEIDPEEVRREEAELARGKNERSFYDDLAKQEDAKHNAMRAEIQKRSLLLGDVRQKLRHKESELETLKRQIRDEEDRIEYEAKKEYRLGDTNNTPDGDGAETPRSIPILSKDIDKNDVDAEFSVERSKARIKELESARVVKESEVRAMTQSMHDEERAISQLQHNLLRM